MNDMEEALARIHREAKELTGELDLRGLDLNGLPDELFRLTHLRGLCMGSDEYGKGRIKFAATAPRLAELNALERLDFANGDVRDLHFLRALPLLKSLNCSRAQIIDLGPLSRLAQLQSLVCWSTQITDLGPLSGLTQLQSLDCWNTQITDLGQLRGLAHLQSLNCGHTQITDLGPLSGLAQLQSLNCSYTKITDLGPLSGLTQLQSLNCSETKITDLGPLSGLTQLQSLNCSETKITDLGPLSGLTQLQSLDCWNTHITDLGPLSGLAQLQSLYCWNTHITDLGPLSGLTRLQSLYCGNTQITDLRPLSGLTQLQSLHCGKTQITDVGPLSGLTQLQSLYCSECALRHLPEELIRSSTLTALHLSGTTIPGWPPTGIFSENYHDNCLPRVRAHLDDLAEGAQADQRVKLLILGNGGAGKTQIANWLHDASYRLNPDWDSTHGIQVQTAPMGGEPPLILSVWDFGGQDIYHGAHALFLNSPSLLLLVWARDTEERRGHGGGDLWFRDHPLSYWLALARQQAHRFSPILLAQSKCDRPADRERTFPVDEGALAALPYPAPPLHLSVGTGKGREALREELLSAAEWLRQPGRMGMPMVGKGRLTVRDRLEEMRARGTRLLPMAEFRDLCAGVGGVSAPEHLLTWLDAEGVVFHRPGLFEDQVVLDPSWALDAIYAIFDRASGVLKTIRRQDGKFRPDLLSDTLWKNFTPDERELFLSMMVSCGICFLLREGRDADGDPFKEYVAPDLLPEREAVAGRVPVRWSDALPVQETIFTYPMLHGGLIRTILSLIGSKAGEDALYWRGGVCGYETRRRSRFLIEQEPEGQWGGRIRLRTQEGDADGLLTQLVEIVEKAQAMVGLRGERPEPMRPRLEKLETAAPAPEPPTLRFGPDPLPVRQWYVSYAWGDQTDEGRAREKAVDDLCAAAEAQGIRILRDRNELGPGSGRISAFMDRIAAGDRIFIVLSEKYLKSPYCMYELHAVWRRCRDEAEFMRRIRLWALPDAAIWKPKDWRRWSSHWYAEYKELSDDLRPTGDEPMGVVSEGMIRRLKQTESFYTSVGDILESLTDHVQPREWAAFLEYGLRDDAPATE